VAACDDPDTCQDLDDKIRSLTLGSDLRILQPWLDTVPDVEQCVGAGLLRAAETEDWSPLSATSSLRTSGRHGPTRASPAEC
jgi:hypothetical protein